MFFRAKDIQLSSYFKVNLSKGQSSHLKKMSLILVAILYSLLIKPNLGEKKIPGLEWNCVRTG